MLVKVAIDLALDRLFTYAVPEELEKKLAVGQLLLVPFGHREARGFAMEIENSSIRRFVDSSNHRIVNSLNSESAKHQIDKSTNRRIDESINLKPVRAIVDEVPFFSEKLLELVKRIAAYYAAPIEKVLKAAVPSAVIKPNARPREQLYVEAVPEFKFVESSIRRIVESSNPECANSQIDKSTNRRVDKSTNSRQRWLYDQIVRLGGGWREQLCEELKTTPATLAKLAALGALTITPREKRRNPLSSRRILPTKPLPLNAEQQEALRSIGNSSIRRFVDSSNRIIVNSINSESANTRIDKSMNRRIDESINLPILLHGVTGSGKTEVYLQAIAKELEAGRGAIVMVPEIALTPQTVQRFASRFGDRIAVLHSALSDGERYDEWHRIRSGKARVVVGPRSAVFAPVKDLGLIVVDEEHETSYKQEESPRYNARDVAVLRGQIEGAKVVLGSATPSLESWANVARGKYAIARMTKRAGAGTLPLVHVIDMKEQQMGIYSPPLLDAIRLRLDRGEQTILFLNRRGYSRSVVCRACGEALECPDCAMPYTYHQADSCCRCHICGGWIPVPAACPACGAKALEYKGIGTQRAEAALAKLFPRARILRMDADSTSRKNSHDDILAAFRRHDADILLGTQMIAKGLDFPNVTLVGVLSADSSLQMPDFRAAERTFQLLAQVSGRAGRAELPGEVFIQTLDPEATAIVEAARGDFAAFARGELESRKAGDLPPYCHLAAIRVASEDARAASDWAEMYSKSLASWAKKFGALTVSDAYPSALEKAEGWYRYQVVLRAPTAAPIVRAWRWVIGARPPQRGIRVAIDIDAANIV